MKERVYLLVIISFLFNGLIYGEKNETRQQGSVGWRAGVARVNITPLEPMWMAGYASRDHASEGTLHDLWVKILALEDANGKKVMLITSDIVGFTKILSDKIRDKLNKKYGLSKAQIILNSSHTHTGPEIDLEKYVWRAGIPDPVQVEKIKKYCLYLEDKVVASAGVALSSMEAVDIYSQNGVARFQVNRRNNTEAKINMITDLKGPNDYAVPVLKVERKDGSLKAVAFGYSCHATVLSLYQWSGDYPGFAQIELEKMYPGTTALFFQCTGADQNPLPRRTVALAKQYGKELAAAVERVLGEDMRILKPQLAVSYSEIRLKFSKNPTRNELLKMTEEFTGLNKSWAQYMLSKVEKGEALITSYPYPLQVWRLGDQPIMVLGGEVVVEYALNLKKIFGEEIFVLGYSNDPNMAYIPSSAVLNEGGYEGETSQMAKGLPSKWAPGIETQIMNELERLAAKTGVPHSQSKK